MAHQSSAMRASITSLRLNNSPPVVDTSPSDLQPPGVDEEESEYESLEEALLGE